METTNDNLIDKQLYISMQQGNKKAFDILFIKYYAMLCAFARSFVSLEDAEEVVQDTMLQIWENRKTNHIDSSVHHYLFKKAPFPKQDLPGNCRRIEHIFQNGRLQNSTSTKAITEGIKRLFALTSILFGS